MRTLFTIVSTSSGMIVRRSITSASIPSPASASAASSARGTICPAATSVIASPSRAIRATPKGTKCSPTGTSPLEAKSAFGSSMMTGSPARSAVFIRPLASAGVEGTQTIRPGICAKTGW